MVGPEEEMDLTVPVGATALIVTVGTILLIIREVSPLVWRVLPTWFRLTLLCALVMTFLAVLMRQ